MHVPKDEQPNIILQIFHGINVVLTEQSTVRGVKTVPNVPVVIYDVTLQLQNINDDQTYTTRNSRLIGYATYVIAKGIILHGNKS